MALIHGKSAYVSLATKDLSAYTTSSEFAFKADSHDVTTYGATGHTYAPGLTDGTVKLDGVYDSTASTGPRAVLEPLVGTTAAFVRRPEGTGSGKPQDACSVVVTSYTESAPVADYIKWSCELQISGAVTTTAQSA